ncbi:hypothetical protein J4458_07480 [Candidatus Woesearchaeota archaeon]|nr:hypothetical protein [Candidatus Woesearchaeota archaeon]
MNLIKNVPLLKKFIEIGYTIALIVILSVIVGLILAFPVKWLWNFVFGELYTITVLQAWALNVLTGILLGQKSTNK